MAGALHLQKRFKTEESKQQVARLVRQCGVDDAMRILNIKSRDKFLRFVTRLVDAGGFCDISPVKGLRRGQKRMFLDKHQETIQDCVEIFGEEWTMEHFCLGTRTLDRRNGSSPRRQWQKQTHAEAAKLKADTALSAIESLEKRLDRVEHTLSIFDTRIEKAEEGNRVNNIELKQQLEQYGQFVEKVSSSVGAPVGQFFKLFIAFYLQNVIPIDKSMEILEQLDPLDIESLIPDNHKRKQRAKVLEEFPLLEIIERLKESDNGNKV